MSACVPPGATVNGLWLQGEAGQGLSQVPVLVFVRDFRDACYCKRRWYFFCKIKSGWKKKISGKKVKHKQKNPSETKPKPIRQTKWNARKRLQTKRKLVITWWCWSYACIMLLWRTHRQNGIVSESVVSARRVGSGDNDLCVCVCTYFESAWVRVCVSARMPEPQPIAHTHTLPSATCWIALFPPLFVSVVHRWGDERGHSVVWLSVCYVCLLCLSVSLLCLSDWLTFCLLCLTVSCLTDWLFCVRSRLMLLAIALHKRVS